MKALVWQRRFLGGWVAETEDDYRAMVLRFNDREKRAFACVRPPHRPSVAAHCTDEDAAKRWCLYTIRRDRLKHHNGHNDNAIVIEVMK